MQKHFFILLLTIYTHTSSLIITSDIANPSASSAPTTPRSCNQDIFNHKLECLDPFHKKQDLIIQSLEIIKLDLKKKKRPLTTLEADKLIASIHTQHLHSTQTLFLTQATKMIHSTLNTLVLDDDKQNLMIKNEIEQRRMYLAKNELEIHQSNPINIIDWLASIR